MIRLVFHDLSINSVFNTYAIADVISRHFMKQQKAARK